MELRVGAKSQTVRDRRLADAHSSTSLLPARRVKASATSTASTSNRRNFRRLVQGGIRLMLVATDKNAAPATRSRTLPPSAAKSSLTNQSRDRHASRVTRRVSVFYLARHREHGARAGESATARSRSSCRTGSGRERHHGRARRRPRRLTGRQVTVQAPFAPRHTFVQVGIVAALTSSCRIDRDRAELSSRHDLAGGRRQESRRRQATPRRSCRISGTRQSESGVHRGDRRRRSRPDQRPSSLTLRRPSSALPAPVIALLLCGEHRRAVGIVAAG